MNFSISQLSEYLCCSESAIVCWERYIAAMNDIGFSDICLVTKVSSGNDKYSIECISNISDEFIQQYSGKVQTAECSFSQNCFTSTKPMLWLPKGESLSASSDIKTTNMNTLPAPELFKKLRLSCGIVLPINIINSKAENYVLISVADVSNDNGQFEKMVRQHLEFVVNASRLMYLGVNTSIGQLVYSQYGCRSVEALTHNETQTLKWLSNGCSIDEISSQKIYKSRDSVNIYIKNAKRKLQVKSRDQLIAKSMMLGLI